MWRSNIENKSGILFSGTRCSFTFWARDTVISHAAVADAAVFVSWVWYIMILSRSSSQLDMLLALTELFTEHQALIRMLRCRMGTNWSTALSRRVMTRTSLHSQNCYTVSLQNVVLMTIPYVAISSVSRMSVRRRGGSSPKILGHCPISSFVTESQKKLKTRFRSSRHAWRHITCAKLNTEWTHVRVEQY